MIFTKGTMEKLVNVWKTCLTRKCKGLSYYKGNVSNKMFLIREKITNVIKRNQGGEQIVENGWLCGQGKRK